jgi:hypothetical protein
MQRQVAIPVSSYDMATTGLYFQGWKKAITAAGTFGSHVVANESAVLQCLMHLYICSGYGGFRGEVPGAHGTNLHSYKLKAKGQRTSCLLVDTFTAIPSILA